MINRMKKVKPRQRKKFLFLRAGEGEEEDLIRNSIRRRLQRKLRSCSPMRKRRRIAIGQRKRKRRRTRLLEGKEGGIEEIGMITKGEAIKKVVGNLEGEGIGKGRKEEGEGDITIEIPIETMKVEAAIIEGEDKIGIEMAVDMEEIEMAVDMEEEIEMVERIIGEEITMNKDKGEEIIEEEVMVIEVEAGAILETLTMIETTIVQLRLNK